MKLFHVIGLCLVAAYSSVLCATPQKRSFTFGFVAKSQGNPVFQAARVGAEEAARVFGKKHQCSIRIDWRTPNEEDAQKQAEAVEQLILSGTDGIAMSVSDSNKVTDLINRAVAQGVPVAMFDSDAPASARFVFYGIDDRECGRQLLETLAQRMGGKGVVAVLGGNPNAPNLQQRVEGVREAAKRYPSVVLRDVFYHKETPQDAVAKVEQVMHTHPDIEGWAMIGGWALISEDAMPWLPGTVTCVSVDALPQELAYIRSGHVAALLAQPAYEWGWRSVENLVNKILLSENPAEVRQIAPFTFVTKENVDHYATQWSRWIPRDSR